MNYQVTISAISTEELTKKQRISIKDFGDAVQLDEATTDGIVILDVALWAKCHVHNEKSDNIDYDKLVIVTKDGEKYVTGSVSFETAFMQIENELDGDYTDFQIKCFKRESNNYKGKYFLTCSIA